MDAVRRFWRQRSSHYRNFQIVCTLLAAHFLIPAVAYLVAPGATMGQFSMLNEWLGGEPYRAPEAASYYFRFLAVSYAAGMGAMLLWMQANLRNRFAILAPVVFMKAVAAVLWLGGFFVGPGEPAMLAAGLFDVGICLVLSVVTLLARADAHRLADGALVPQPAALTGLEWAPFEQRWVESILAATIPARPEDDLPGFDEIELGDFWQRYIENVPIHFRLGLRLSTWVVTFWPILTLRSIRTFHGLSEDRKDDVLRSIEHSPWFVVRQLTFVFKTTASFAYFRDAGVQQRFPTAYRSVPEAGPPARDAAE